MDIMKEQKPVGPSWKGFEQIFWVVVVSPLPGKMIRRKHQLVFFWGVVPKRTNMITRGDERVVVLDWSVILRFFLDPLGFKDKTASFPQASKAKNSQASTHVKLFAYKKRNIYISCFYQNPSA